MIISVRADMVVYSSNEAPEELILPTFTNPLADFGEAASAAIQAKLSVCTDGRKFGLLSTFGSGDDLQ